MRISILKNLTWIRKDPNIANRIVNVAVLDDLRRRAWSKGGKLMKCYLGDACIRPVEMLHYLKCLPGNEDFSYNDPVPFEARQHCMEIDCFQFEKICQLADEYQALQAKLSEKQPNPK